MEWFSAFAFGAGMVGLINPCGFALLPAYLGYFLGLNADESADTPVITSLNRAQVVGLSLSLGFLAVFGGLGLALAGSINSLNSSGLLPRFTIAVGVGLLILAVAMFRGYQPVLKLPKLNKGGDDRSIFSMFVFGVSYALASLTCTIGPFTAAVGISVVGENTTPFSERLGSFISYGLGMGLLATVLTLAVGFG
ncbi:MAG: cytochrome c biogenesis protein CcdA, partial [Actinomycetota bacterium]